MQTVRFLSCLSLTALAAFGCNAIIGVEEANLNPNVISRGSGGSTSGSGGGSGTGGGSSGPAGITVNPDGCGAGIEVDESLILGCLLRVSCDPLVPPYNVSQCVTFATQTWGGSEFCTYRADTCGKVQECIGRGFDVGDNCSGLEGEWTCDGDVGVYCDGNSSYTLDCGAEGAVCVPGEASPYASIGPCSADESLDCSAATEGDFYCDDDVLYTCSSGTPFGIDCRESGQICHEATAGTAVCTDRTTPCNNPGETTCSGDRINQCDSSGFFVSYDCATADLKCEQDGTSVAYCLADGCTKSANCVERCLDSETLQFCQGGTPVELDCTAYGFEQCLSSTLSGGQTTYAGCFGGTGPTEGGEAQEDEDSCQYSQDGTCDEPVFCLPYTDKTDCADARDACATENNGVCDVPTACPFGSDNADCKDASLPSICCHSDDPCDFQDTGTCDCPTEAWDAADCK